MKLTLRLLLAAILPVALIILGNGVLRVQREVRLLTEEVAIHQRAMGRALAAGIDQVWAEGADSAARTLLAAAGQREDLIQLAWLSASDELGDVPPAARAALAHNEVLVTGAPGARGDERLASTVPVIVDGALVGAIVLTEKLAREDAYLSATVLRVGANTLIAIFAVSLVMALVGWFFVARRIDALVRLVRRIGDEQQALEIVGVGEGRDELSTLAREIRSSHERLVEARVRADAEARSRLRAVEQLRHADRLATVGQLASGMAHELGTPLNVALGRARMLQDGVPAEKQAAYLDVIVRQIERMTSIVRHVLDFSRRNTPATSEVELLTRMKKTASLLAPTARASGIELTVTGEEVQLAVDPVQIDQVVSNLVMNAIQACASGDHVVIDVGRRLEDGTGAPLGYVRVSDDGPGIDPEVKARVFDPFFTTKEVGQGTGLGLAVAHGIALDHGGRIELESRPGAGSSFTLLLPMEGR